MSAVYYSFWLIPQERDLAYFQGIINTLAKQFDTVPFSPHVTLYSGSLPASLAVESVLSALSSSPVELEVITLNHELQFSKTLYVQLSQNVWLNQLVNDLAAAIPDAQPPKLDPHLSLLYHQRLDAATKQTLIETLVLPRPTIRFDQVQAIAASENFETQDHVVSLRCVHRQLLTAP